MATIPGPGPIFVYEWITGTRRWQLYATRALFVTALLVALASVWESSGAGTGTIRQASAKLAENAYYAIVGTQLALVLLAAPAATAGAVCLDKARGTLAHVLVTDLTDAEIILGKLAARLSPVLTFVACSLPVVSLCSLLGGIDPQALPRAYLVTVAVTILGCALALLLSIWARKTHEVLLAVYLIWVVWLLAMPMARMLNWMLGSFFDFTNLVRFADPFELAFATYLRPSSTTIDYEVGAFFVGCLVLSAVLLIVAVLRVRSVVVEQAGRVERSKRRRPSWSSDIAAVISELRRRLPGPSLDGNPVLWREWHRNRPSGWTRMIWAVYVGGAIVFTVIAFLSDLGAGGFRGWASLWVNGFQVAIGLLLLSVGAATSLAEERVRGSLDVLMATPLPTRSVVWGKWLGTFRAVPWLLVLPVPLAATLAVRSDRWGDVFFLALEILAFGAFITSVGLAVATWVPRLGRAVALCVIIHVVVTVGTFFLVLLMRFGGPPGERALAFSPFGGPAILTVEAAGNGGPHREEYWGVPMPLRLILMFGWESLAIGFYLTTALVLYLLTLRSFNRCLGRASVNPLVALRIIRARNRRPIAYERAQHASSVPIR